MTKTKYISKGADISLPMGTYRYLLWREWRGTHSRKNWRWLGGKDGAGAELGEPKSCLFIMLNPSTADGEFDDPTIRRCISFAKEWRYERLEVVNLFAYRASKPAVLFGVTKQQPGFDLVGAQNQEFVETAAHDAGVIVCAWGSHGGYIGQDETMRGWLGDRKLFALGFTQDGHPKHPLFVPSGTKLVPMPD